MPTSASRAVTHPVERAWTSGPRRRRNTGGGVEVEGAVLGHEATLSSGRPAGSTAKRMAARLAPGRLAACPLRTRPAAARAVGLPVPYLRRTGRYDRLFSRSTLLREPASGSATRGQ